MFIQTSQTLFISIIFLFLLFRIVLSFINIYLVVKEHSFDRIFKHNVSLAMNITGILTSYSINFEAQGFKGYDQTNKKRLAALLIFK